MMNYGVNHAIRWLIESCAVVTTHANEQLSAIHDRMPVVLEQERALAWLAPGTEKSELLTLLKPSEAEMEMVPVSSYVNNSRNNGPECIQRA